MSRTQRGPALAHRFGQEIAEVRWPMTRQAHTGILEGDVAGRRREVAETTVERSTAADQAVTLVRRAQGGDTDAFDALARLRIDHEFRLAVAILRSEVDAQDVVQDAFVSAWRQLPALRDPARFDAWLDRIVVNGCRMALRHRHVVLAREIDVEDPEGLPLSAGTGRSPRGPAEAVADADLVRRAFERLDPDKRAILVLHHVEDRPIDEIAAVLRIPSGTVKWRLHAARGALQRALEEESR